MKRVLAVALVVVGWVVYREWQARRSEALALDIVTSYVRGATEIVRGATDVLRSMP